MMIRTECFKHIAQHVGPRDIIVSSYSSAFEWLALDPPGIPYYIVGAMGLDTSAALGLALAMPDRRIITLQGDGSLMMNLGSLATLVDQDVHNVVHVCCRNTIYEANGGQPIPNGAEIDYPGLARASGLTSVFHFKTLDDMNDGFAAAIGTRGPVFICVDVTAGEPPKLDYARLHAPDLVQQFQRAIAETA